jgi:hypothetical protein
VIPTVRAEAPGCGWRAVIAVAICLFVLSRCLHPTPAYGLDVKFWPLLDYHSDASGRRSLHLFGPLFSYATGPEGSELTLRPLFSLTRGPRAADNEATLLYPLFVARWDPQRTEYRLFGLISYLSEPGHGADQWDRRFTVFPLVFYRESRLRGTSLSVLPFYADLQNFFGYERVRMIAFPLYLHLEKALVERTWLPFPFVSWVGGKTGRGFRVFPFYGWEQSGETERLTYVLWPFYVSHERNFTRPERERRLILYPFYSTIDSPRQWSRSYVFPFFLPLLTHAVDRQERTEAWGFPWPAWLSQRRLDTGARTALRLWPFYEDTHFGDVHARFVMWPLYRWSTQEVGDYHFTRSDVLLMLYRRIDEVDSAQRHRRRLHTLFPLYRINAADGDEEWSTLALLDALLPRNPTVRRVYAPLWQLYSWRRDREQPPRWSLLWDLVSSDGTQIRSPVHLHWSD